MTDLVESKIVQFAIREPDCVLREVIVGHSLVDLLAVDFDTEAVQSRTTKGIGPIELPLRVAVLSQLREDRWAMVDRLARVVGSQPRALSRSTLRPLADLGLIELAGTTRVRSTGLWTPVLHRATAVELKLSKWRRAARQADNAAWVSDRAWVVLDRARSTGALDNDSYFKEFGIGLALIDSKGGLRIVRRPARRQKVRWRRALLGEVAWARAIGAGQTPKRRKVRRGNASGPETRRQRAHEGERADRHEN